MIKYVLSIVTVTMACAMTMPAALSHDDALDFKMDTIDGESVDLDAYKGKVVLIVNVASQCGLTKQYAGLQALYEKYKDQGFVILGFPCNQFGSQEPGTSAQIKQFCSSKYSVTFPMFAKIEVNGKDACPLYQYLTSIDAQPKGKGNVQWNFEKFLIDADGHVVARYNPRTAPADAQLVKNIESLLAK